MKGKCPVDKIMLDNREIKITNPDKILWPSLGIRKIDYIVKLIELAPFILPHTTNRLLTTIRYPDGVEGKSFYQKNIPQYAPEWVESVEWKNTHYIVLNSIATLGWLANQAALEFHTAFNYYQYQDYPTSLVFDLDPSKGQPFEQVVEVALIIFHTLTGLGINSYVKTSGATGLQIYIPIGIKYNYDLARLINHFFGEYFSRKFSKLITIERMTDKRGNKLYFDYLQMWHGKTITSVYSPRATVSATISTPLEWEELNKGIKPEDFTLLNIRERLEDKGDLFAPLLQDGFEPNIDHIAKFVSKNY